MSTYNCYCLNYIKVQHFANYTYHTTQNNYQLKMMFALVCQSAFFLMLALKALSQSSSQSIYLYPDMFKDNYYNVAHKNVTPKDVAAFKLFCIQDHISSIVKHYAHIFIFEVSDSTCESVAYITSFSYYTG